MAPATPAAPKAVKNVHVSILDDGIAIIKLDMQGAKVNTLSLSLSSEMGALLDQLVGVHAALV